MWWWEDPTQYTIFAARCRGLISLLDMQELRKQLIEIRELPEKSK